MDTTLTMYIFLIYNQCTWSIIDFHHPDYEYVFDSNICFLNVSSFARFVQETSDLHVLTVLMVLCISLYLGGGGDRFIQQSYAKTDSKDVYTRRDWNSALTLLNCSTRNHEVRSFK